MEILIRLGLFLGISILSYSICAMFKQEKNSSLLFIIMSIVSFLGMLIWDGEYRSFLRSIGIASLLVMLIQVIRNVVLKKV